MPIMKMVWGEIRTSTRNVTQPIRDIRFTSFFGIQFTLIKEHYIKNGK